jgi:predicted AlkP superfamily pyrophosphatase or phosphodiesterase
MRRIITTACAALFMFGACRPQQPLVGSNTPNEQAQQEALAYATTSTQPKLVVGIVIDQLRHDYLFRYTPYFSEGGFKRMLNEGFYHKNTHYNYVPTVTGPGHASVYAGTTPAVHGIVGNGWYSRQLGRSVYCAEDTVATAVGSNSNAGRISSRNLLSTNLADELKLSTNMQAKVVGISIKDRGAAFPAGHMPDGAYWFDGKYGKFISSTYFTQELPDWMSAFNERRLVQQYMDSTWNTLMPLEVYEAPDNTPYERVLEGKETPTFPYDLAALKGANGNYGLFTYTPFANTVVKELAKAAIEGEQMGQDEVPDLLAISFSSTDILGHSFGPRSVEVQDMYMRLDRDIENLLDYLDEAVGQGEYLVFLTADHAAAEVPQYLIDQNIPAGYFNLKGLSEEVEAFLAEVFGVEGLVEDATNLQFYLNHQRVHDHQLNLAEVQQTLAAWLRDQEGVAAVYTATQLQEQGYREGVAQMLQKGYYYKNSGDVFMVLDPAWMDYARYGTTHGSGYTYDTHVPLLWYGWGVKAGSSARKQHITDIAPTVSFMLDISLPNGATGEPIRELLEERP